MSISLAHGFRFSTPHLLDIHHLLVEWRPVLAELSRASICKEIAARVAARLDSYNFGSGTNRRWSFSEVYTEMRGSKRESDANNQRNPSCDFDFRISIIPFEGAVYGLILTEQTEWADRFREEPWVEDFRFWDSTDGDEDVPADEWQARGAIWKEIFNGAAKMHARQLGFYADLSDHDFYWPRSSDIAAAMPSIESRIKKIAFERTTNERLGKNWADGLSAEQAMQAVVEASFWASSPEGLVCLEKHTQELRDGGRVMPITKEML